MSMTDDLRRRLASVSTPIMRGDNLAIVLASYFEPQVESDELDESETWKQGAIDAADEILDAIHAYYAGVPEAPPSSAEVAVDERALAALIARYYRQEIGRLMQQAEHWAANAHPLAVHHRLHKAQAYYQIVALMERFVTWGKNPFDEMRSDLARGPIKPPGAWPWSIEMHRYFDARSVAAMMTPVAAAAANRISAGAEAAEAALAEARNNALREARDEIRYRRQLLDTQNVAIDVVRELDIYAICEEAILALIQPATTTAKLAHEGSEGWKQGPDHD